MDEQEELSLQPIDPRLEVPPEKLDLGEEATIDHHEIHIRLGSRPIVVDLVDALSDANHPVPDTVRARERSFRTWLLMTGVNFLKEPGHRDVQKLAVEIDLPDEPRIHILDVFPKTQYVTRGSANVAARFKAGLDLGGHLTLPATAPVAGARLAAGSATVEAGVNAELLANISFEIATPQVEAVGTAGSYAQWVFTRYQRPLVGDHLVCATLLVPRNLRRLAYRARVTATVRTWGLTESPWATPWTELGVDLPKKRASPPAPSAA